MAEFFPIKSPNAAIIEVNGKKGVFVQFDNITAPQDLINQQTRMRANDAIVEQIFGYVRELRAITGSPNILIADVIQKLRRDIIADYPSDVRAA